SPTGRPPMLASSRFLGQHALLIQVWRRLSVAQILGACTSGFAGINISESGSYRPYPTSDRIIPRPNLLSHSCHSDLRSDVLSSTG
ncbi:hypothetical protein PENTCL1PPCAC_19991, partial [Pristionchus entomophagus]